MGVLFIFLSASSFLLYQGTSGVDTEVSVKEGDSVTLHTGVKKTKHDSIMWYINDARIARINGNSSKICTDVQCNESNERFRGRLKLDHQTGSLTITNIRNTDSGEYKLLIGTDSEKIFSVTVHGVSAAERDEMKRKSVKEGESVTLDPDVTKNLNDSVKWYFKDTLIAEITGDQSQICTDVQCEERFRDRLKLDHQTGSLTITNTRNTDSGEYTLKINSRSLHRRRRSISSVKSFSVTVIGPGRSSGVVAGIVVAAAVLLVFAAVAVIYRRRRIFRKAVTREKERTVLSVESFINEMEIFLQGEKTEVT